MTAFQKLKHEARRAEQRSDWARAIELYKQALSADEDMADLSLYNRIGDLHLRLGETEAAVESYERAIERYSDNGMLTSAIALCNKILRIAPGRTGIHRHLANFHARTGLVVEGRAAILTYARRCLEAGTASAATAGVEEFVELTGDEQVRLDYAEVLKRHGDEPAAAAQLRMAGAESVDEPPEPVAASPVELASLVSERLDEIGEGADFTTTADPAEELPSMEDDSLDGVRRVLGRFRRQVADTVSEDLTVRYDLGVEFMTIGLLTEAIEEFQLAIVDPALVEAANARIGECLALRASDVRVDAPRRSARRTRWSGSRPAAPRSAAGGRSSPPPASEAVEAEAIRAEAYEADERADVPDPASPGEGEDELQGHFFRARLAQYRVRRAEERHTVDHTAHLDLGTAYVEMGLHQEALRELSVALAGPRPVAGRAARALKRLALAGDVEPELAFDVLKRLAESDTGAVADTLATTLAERWTDTHPLAGQLRELRGDLTKALEELPDLEALFPALEASIDDAGTDGVATPAPESGGTPDVAVIDGVIVPPARSETQHDPFVEALAGAAVHVEEGEIEEAAALLRGAFEHLREAGRTRDALSVLERLLELLPDNAPLHRERAELAGMVNDRDLMLTSWAELGECLRRAGENRRARAAFGRMLDIDPTDEPARHAIARIDADELEVEREATRSHARTSDDPSPASGDPSAATDGDPEVDELLAGLSPSSREDSSVVPVELEEDSPDSDEALATSRYELGQAFRQMGMWEEAVRELRPALAATGDRLEVLEALGECLIMAGRPADAIELLESKLRADEDERQVGPLYHLGLALQMEGEAERARSVLSRVQAAHPGYRDTDERLSELSL